MQKHNLEDISFTHHTYKGGLEFIGYAEYNGENAGIIKAEHLPRLSSVTMYKLVTVPEYRRIGIATSLIEELVAWTESLNTTKIICVLQSVLLQDSTTNFEKYLVKRGFKLEGMLFSKDL